ncbi:hypothetical protein F5Y16DRAFT_188334 [Xylariaceae sp. FL0255]|nr:hypothetical protein F5Y16DRAFT_188334 [Xylariaceae sp. FL0255]
MEPPSGPITPTKQSRKRPAEESPASSSASPTKKPRTPQTPRTPSKAALKKAEVAKKAQWKTDWAKWVEQSRWEKDPDYQQKVGSSEIHKTDAKTFYSLTNEELDTLPYWEFENEYNPSYPGRSYPHEAVLMLVHRKFAILAGFHNSGLSETGLLKKGKELFDVHDQKKRERNPNRPKQPRMYKLVVKDPYKRNRFSLPGGAWESPVWEDGRIIGHFMNLQFDPHDYDADFVHEDYPTARFRPIGSDRWE